MRQAQEPHNINQWAPLTQVYLAAVEFKMGQAVEREIKEKWNDKD
jgi:hypothetical protein